MAHLSEKKKDEEEVVDSTTSTSHSSPGSIKETPANNTTTDTPKAEEEDDDIGPAPEGGLRAWLVAAGAACIFFAAMGYANSFGAFQEYYQTHQLSGRTPDEIAWIGSISSFLMFAAGAAGGPLFDRFGVRVIQPAAVVFVLAVMLTSLCTEYWHFMLAHGILTGAATGVLTFPCMAAVSQFFDRRRAAALGVAISGSSLGGIVIPIALSKMLNDSGLGFGWSVRVVGFVAVPFLAFAVVVMRARVPPRRSDFFKLGAFRDRTYVLLIASVFFLFGGMFTPLFYLPSYAVSRGVDPALAAYLLAVLNGASTFGRIVPGVLADRVGRFNMLAALGLATGVIIFCMDSARSTAGLVVYAVFVGFTSGGIISGGSAAMAVTAKSPKDLGTYMGMGMAVGSLATLVGPPVNGVLVRRFAGFFEASMFSGALCIVGGLLVLATKASTPQGLWGKI